MIRHVGLIVGLEIHVELATRTKMFTRALSPAHASMLHAEPEPNTLIDATVLALPGSLPVMNRRAVELSIMVGRALNCAVAPFCKWDRKNYFYPDMPKAYQVSQYDLPLCGEGYFDLPATDAAGFPDFAKPTTRVRIQRAHLEEDAGKLLHEAPGGHVIDHSIVDYNRAGTPLLEIVTHPDFSNADDVVLFAKCLRSLCLFLHATEGVMQKGHMRFEPNINCELTLEDGSKVRTPVVEVKNLNSFKSLRGAIDFELADQPRRWLADRRVMGPGAKTTRGWDDTRSITFVQREKEDAHDYRYFPDPDLLPVVVDAAWLSELAAAAPEPPLERMRRYTAEYGIAIKEAAQLADDPAECDFYESVIFGLVSCGVPVPRAGKLAANAVLGSLMKLANEHGLRPSTLGVSPLAVAAVAALREDGMISNQAVEPLLSALRGTPEPASAMEGAEMVRAAAQSAGLLIERDDGAMLAWIDQVLSANPKAVEDVKAGKLQAAGKLVGDVMKLAAGKADAKGVREAILARING
ncbi:MAG: Asp-tRNA(Asn)/Glu-tRNA(Gln) amidotransferase subunit GatB [Phycisphaerales bacterium]